MKKLVSSLLSILFLLAFTVLNVQAQKPVTVPYIELVRQSNTPPKPDPNRDRIYITTGGSVIIINSDGTPSGFGGMDLSNGLVLPAVDLGGVSTPPLGSVTLGYDPVAGLFRYLDDNAAIHDIGWHTLTTGINGSAPNVSSIFPGDYVINIPLMTDSSVTAGLLSDTTQTIPGNKTFSGSVTAGDISSGLVSANGWNVFTSNGIALGSGFPIKWVPNANANSFLVDGDVDLKRASAGVLKITRSDASSAYGNLLVGAILPARKTIVLADDATSIDVANCNTVTVSTSGTAPSDITINTITNGVDGQHLTILPGDAFFNIDNSTAVNIKLKTSNWLSSDGKALSLVFDGTFWWEN